MPDFYLKHPGYVISTTIDKFVYVAVNRILRPKVSVKYSVAEEVSHPKNLLHPLIRAVLLDLNIHSHIEIASLADISAKSGLGSSSSFSVALAKALYAYLGRNLSKEEAARAACRLEIELLKEPIGKQDQYAASYGGFNIFHFNMDGSVEVEPVAIDFKKKRLLEDHILVFFTGQLRYASSVLSDQRSKVMEKINVYKKMANLVYPFRDAILKGDQKKAGEILNVNWFLKKKMTERVSNPIIDKLYQVGMDMGAWGGKLLGAGGGGCCCCCLLFLADPLRHSKIIKATGIVARKNNLQEFSVLPVKLVECGSDILFKSDYH